MSFKNNKKNMVKSLSLASLVLLGSQLAHARTWDQIQQSGELKVGMTGDYSPLTFHSKTGELKGFDVDMTTRLAKSMGLKVHFVKTSWPTLSADLAADKFDVAAGGVTKTQKREKQFYLSDSVAKNGKIILTNCANTKSLQTLEEINKPNVSVIVNPGGTNQAYVDSHITNAKIIRTKDNFANLQGIRENTADVMITDLIEGNYYQLKEKGVFCVSSKQILAGTSSVKAYMVKKDNKQLLNKINAWLEGSDKMALAKHWGISE